MGSKPSTAAPRPAARHGGAPARGPLVVAVSSRALFDFEEENKVFEEQGTDSYADLQKERIDSPPTLGVAYRLVRKLLRFNSDGVSRVDVVIVSRNNPVTGLRIFKAIEHYGMDIGQGIFTAGKSPAPYLEALGAHLYLSAHALNVRSAIERNVPSARVYVESEQEHCDESELRIAFDGDAVLFSDEAEALFQREGLNSFVDNETRKVMEPLSPGPFKHFLDGLVSLKQSLPEGFGMGIRTALITARAAPAHERPIRTLMRWGLDIDEAFFMAGTPKGSMLRSFNPDFFFDDKVGNCDHANDYAPTGHVNYGVANEAPELA